MAVDNERALIAKVVREQAFGELSELGITAEHFLDPEHLDKYELLRAHFAEHGASMSEETFRGNYPTYKLPRAEEPLTYYADAVRKQLTTRLLSETVSQIATHLDSDEPDLDEALAIYLEGAIDLAESTSRLTDHDLTRNLKKRMAIYDEWAASPNHLRGWPTGFKSVDWTTRGAQKGNVITLTGPTGVGKTTILMYMAMCLQAAGAKVLFISFEMPYEEIHARYDAMGGNVGLHRLLSGKTTEKDRIALLRGMRNNREREAFILSEDIDGATTVSGLRAKIQQHQPDVVFVDGVYMMHDEHGEPVGSTTALTNISRGVKRMALTEKIPVFQSTQALEGKMRAGRVTLHAIGYTSAFAQDSNVVIGVERKFHDDGAIDASKIVLRTLKSRNGPPINSEIFVDWSAMKFDEDDASWSPEEEDTDDGKAKAASY